MKQVSEVTQSSHRTMLGEAGTISVESFKILLEMFSQAITDEGAQGFRPGNPQLSDARRIIFKFYDYQTTELPTIAVEMFNDRLVGNLKNDDSGRMMHSQYQPEPLIRYAEAVVDWGLVEGLVSIPGDITLH